MNIINLTNSPNIEKVIKKYFQKSQKSPDIYGCFILTDYIKKYIKLNNKYAFIIIHSKNQCITFHLLKTTNRLTTKEIYNSLDMFEEFTHDNS